MSRWRIAVVAVLLAGPFVVLAALGGYHLWAGGWGFYAWWPMAASLGLGPVDVNKAHLEALAWTQSVTT